jgi:diacylglycerol kinase (ATP)
MMLRRSLHQLRRALLFINRRVRKARVIPFNIEQYLESVGLEILPVAAQTPHELQDRISQHHSDVEFVIIGGGDGTLREVLPSLVHYNLPLAILPLGTANDIAGSLGILDDLPAACDTAVGGGIRHIDIGDVNGRLFVNNANIGLSSDVACMLTPELKARWGVFASVAVLPQILRRARPFPVTLTFDGKVEKISTVMILIGNGKYDGGFPIRYGGLDDGLLNLTSFDVRHWWNVPEVVSATLRKAYLGSPLVRTLDATVIEIQTEEPKIIVADGDAVGETPAYIRVLPRALSVIVPSTSGHHLGNDAPRSETPGVPFPPTTVASELQRCHKI